MTGAELAARRSAAAAVLGDFRRAMTTSPPGNGHGMHYWATRLADHMGLVLEAAAPPQAEPAKLAAIREVLARFDWGSDDCQIALERIEDIAGATGVVTGTELSGGAYLDSQDRLTVLGAIETAAEYLEYRAGLTCADCAAHPADLCETHSSDLDAAAQYRAVAERLGENR